MALNRGSALGSYGISATDLGASGLEDSFGFAWANASGGVAIDAWDFLTNQARFNGIAVGPLANTPGWSFTRASTGYAATSAGVLTAFSSGALRRTDKGVLIEGARTNLCLGSTLAGGGSAPTGWSQPAGTGTSTPVTSTINPDVIAYAQVATAQRPMLAQSITIANNTTYCFSVYVESVTGTLGVADILATGTVPSGATLTYDTLGNLAAGQRRFFTISGTYTGGSIQFRAGLGVSAGVTGSLQFSMPQLEAASFPSSYIPTTTAPATRAADVLTVPVSGIDYPLSLYAEFERAVDTGGDEGVIQIDDGDSTDRAILNVTPSDLLQMYTRSASVDQSNATIAGALAVRTVYKAAIRTTTNDVRHARSGTLGTADTSATNPATPTTLRFGQQTSSAQLFGYLRRCALWTRALSDSELQSVTT